MPLKKLDKDERGKAKPIYLAIASVSATPTGFSWFNPNFFPPTNKPASVITNLYKDLFKICFFFTVAHRFNKLKKSKNSEHVEIGKQSSLKKKWK